MIVFRKYSALLLLLVFPAITIATDTPTGTLSGRFLLNTGSPMSYASVYLFSATNYPPPALGRYWKTPDHSTETDSHGKFSITIPIGSYYIAAMKRHSADKLGPPVAGDYFYASHDGAGRYREHTVTKNKNASLGTIKGVAPAKESDISYRSDITGISGTIRDKDGNQLGPALVVAYKNPGMTGPPLFTSPRTGVDGKYLLGVHAAGDYYLRVRDVYGGGKPAGGSIIGVYGTDSDPVPVAVKNKSVTSGVDITAERFSLPAAGSSSNP